MASVVSDIETKFQRDLNRTLDSDRNTRKRGLQKLLDELPWAKGPRKELGAFLVNAVLPALLTTISDPVEKCRDLTLQLLEKILGLFASMITYEKAHELTLKLTERIGEVPFLEPAEEMRLKVVERLQSLVTFQHKHIIAFGDNVCPLVENVLQAMCKSLTDSFPTVKRADAELILSIYGSSPVTLKSYFKQLLKGLAVNVNHQHSKTRSITLLAIMAGLKTMSVEDYQSLMKDSIHSILSRLVSDRTPTVRIELAKACADFLRHRLSYCIKRNSCLVKMDLEIVSLLLLLVGDEQEEVASHSKSALDSVAADWNETIQLLTESKLGQFDENGHIIDGEMELAASAAATAVASPESDSGAAMSVEGEEEECIPIRSAPRTVEQFVQANVAELMSIMLQGVDGWTVESKKRSLRGLERLLVFAGDSVNPLLPRILTSLGVQIKDDEAEIRAASEQCCLRLGSQCDMQDVLDILLPRVNGEVAGGDTFQHRTSALRLLTHILAGFSSAVTSAISTVDPISVILPVSVSLANTLLYEFREGIMREAVLLLARTLVQTFPQACKHSEIQRNVCLSLVYLSGSLPSEDTVIKHFALKVLQSLAAIHNDGAASAPEDKRVESLLASHYDFLLASIVRVPRGSSPNWSHNSPALSAFEVLISECPRHSWTQQAAVIPVFALQTQPRVQPAAGSAEANAQSYASQRGEEAIPLIAEVDVRLSLLALLEGFIRKGSDDWESGRHLAETSEKIIKEILLVNLVWRVGKVEATVRKVTLATTYALLKAGAVKRDTLFAVAGELVPLLVGNLDDSELTPRQITCLCLTVVFERLRGAFGEQAIREIYPKLVARLDDSNDVVRIAICGSMNMFFQCAPHNAYSNTTVDYTLDQLFIHLDDPSADIQKAVAQVIITMAALDKPLVLKKAASNRGNHRSPAMCDKIMVEVQGYEILEEDS